MDCCSHGHALTRRQWMWSTVLTSVGAMLSGGLAPRGSSAAAQTAETTSTALDVLRTSISVDVHSHGGTTGITSKAPPNGDLANGMRAGSLAVACLADVPDGPILGRNAAGVLTALRTPEPGLLYQYHLDRLAWIDEMVANHGLRRALTVADLEAAHNNAASRGKASPRSLVARRSNDSSLSSRCSAVSSRRNPAARSSCVMVG
jgi:hypothetical protein